MEPLINYNRETITAARAATDRVTPASFDRSRLTAASGFETPKLLRDQNYYAHSSNSL